MAQRETQSTGSGSTDDCSSESDSSYRSQASPNGDESTSTTTTTEYASTSEEEIREIVAPRIISADEATPHDDFPFPPLPPIPSQSLEMVVHNPLSHKSVCLFFGSFN